MTEEDKLKALIAEGHSADEWLNHPSFKNVIHLLKAEYFMAFEQTKFKDDDVRAEVWRKMQALTAIEQDMQRIISEGRRASETLAEKVKRKVKEVF